MMINSSDNIIHAAPTPHHPLINIILYLGHGTDYLNLALRDGGVSLTMGLSNGKQEMHIKPSRVRFDDHQWHKVTVHRRIQEISATTSFCRVSCEDYKVKDKDIQRNRRRKHRSERTFVSLSVLLIRLSAISVGRRGIPQSAENSMK